MPQLRHDIYEAWVTRASELGPSAGPIRQQSSHRGNTAPASRARPAARLQELRGLRARDSHGEEQQAGSGFFGRSGAALPAGGAAQEFSDLEEFAGRKLKAWDLAFFGERLQESRFKVSQEALRPYFPLPKVLSGLFTLTQRLYGITVRERADVSVWHPSVRYYDLKDARGQTVAGFYLDPYSRTEKRSGAWMDECVIAKALPSGTALPVAQLVCNFTAPVGGAPSLSDAR